MEIEDMPTNKQEFVKWYIGRTWCDFIDLNLVSGDMDDWIVKNWSWLSNDCGFHLKLDASNGDIELFMSDKYMYYFSRFDDVWDQVVEFYEKQ